MSPRGPGAVALTLGFISLRSHPVPPLRRGCENTISYLFLASFSAPWCHLSDGCHLTHDYGTRIRETEERDMSHTTVVSCGLKLQQYQ